jgi:hypothetical protein
MVKAALWLVFFLVLRYSPVRTIPPTIYLHLHLHKALTRGTNGPSLGTVLKSMLFRKPWSIRTQTEYVFVVPDRLAARIIQVTPKQYDRGHCVPGSCISWYFLWVHLTSASEEHCSDIYAEQLYTQPATVAPHQRFSSPLFWTNLQPNARWQTCRYDLLVPLVQVIVSTKTRFFDYIICEDQKYDSRGFVLYLHLNRWQATRGVRQFSNITLPYQAERRLFFSEF